MYLHLGKGTVVPKNNIIGIFDLDITSQSHLTRKYLQMAEKAGQVNRILRLPAEELAPISLSMGIAFADREAPQGDIFQDADAALERLKKAGRSGCEIYE